MPTAQEANVQNNERSQSNSEKEEDKGKRGCTWPGIYHFSIDAIDVDAA